ncbi:Alkanesulfonate monooxygenase [Wickerhamomyces ciferrii]|uniref:Alkanesulfonate monooxygenase n=1 Tax=Wickerhamomyces ciferrii (strain ATCC 14091 / BCRC 22168 / CBS 111 / JCM 3599 / NBRC 0793 / NRRL Y-1031 F-60-10) TaxID=1206466 RepID=K0KNM5_WICCF|nr:Alkanesulfonate monooxygenase [Wickerhamomyces ciferrii]CCH44596.1 Alkanesulfonate monooxygenase [Wickerhamomyces ciferrii]
MSESYKKQKVKGRKPLIINFFEHAAPNHQNPVNESTNYNKISYWTKLAQIAERGKINSIFIGDVLGGYDVYQGPRSLKGAAKAAAQFPTNEPSQVISAMAAVTENLAFGVTFSTISEHPYHFARRIATLDHLTEGRVGWNVVTSYLDSAARNLLNGSDLPGYKERYERAHEYVQVVYELLLSSWRDDAVTKNLERKQYADSKLIREIGFEGKFFNVSGPQITEPSPQRLPVIIQAGSSPPGQNLGAQIAEVIFIGSNTPQGLKSTIDTVKSLAHEKFNRDPDSIKFIAGLQVIVSPTHEEAVAKYNDLFKYADPEGVKALIGGWTGINLDEFDDEDDLKKLSLDSERSSLKRLVSDVPGKVTKQDIVSKRLVTGSHPLIIGTPKEVADEIEKWVDISGIDGFNFAYSLWPGTFEDIVDLLIPELRFRGLAWDDYPVKGGTFRENLYGVKGQTFVPKDHSAYGYKWQSGVDQQDFENQLEQHKELWRSKNSSS